MADFTHTDLSGARFEDVYLTGADFHDVDLTDARFHEVDLTAAMIRGAALVDVDISGEIDNLRVNGVDVVRLVEAELNRRHRVKMRPAGAVASAGPAARRDARHARCAARPCRAPVAVRRARSARRSQGHRAAGLDRAYRRTARRAHRTGHGAGLSESESFAVRRCLQAILNEEWMHRLYAERDLDTLESRVPRN